MDAFLEWIRGSMPAAQGLESGGALWGWILVILSGNFVLSALVIRFYKKKLFRQYNTLLQKLDQVLTGRKLEQSYEESMDSAISERLNRIVEMTGLQKEKAEEERDTVKSLISDLSHQIRTPLANITLYTGLLKEELAEEKVLRLADKIEKNAEKLEFYMRELIRSSYAEQQLISVNPHLTAVDDLIKRGCQLVELTALKKKIRIQAAYHGYQGYADPKWTEEVLGNLIENAVKYSSEGSSVEIDSMLYETFVCIRIQDHGIGIPEEEQGKVFQRFYRASNVKDQQGFGIGLYLAREVFSRQQGYIRLKSALNQGTTAELFLLRNQS